MLNRYWTGYEDGKQAASGGIINAVLNAMLILAFAFFLVSVGFKFGLEYANEKHSELQTVNKRFDKLENQIEALKKNK